MKLGLVWCSAGPIDRLLSAEIAGIGSGAFLEKAPLTGNAPWISIYFRFADLLPNFCQSK